MKLRPTSLVVIIAAGILSEVRAPAQMPATKVVTVEARMVDAPATITLVGTVNPVRLSRVSSEIAGVVEQMPARQGDLISSDGVICKLNDDTLRLRLAEEQARLAGLRARHEELLAGTRKEELVRLKALADEAAVVHEAWKLEMDRIERLYAGSESNNKEYVDTRAQYLAAERREIAAQAAYDLAVEGPRKEVIAQAAHAVAQQQAVADRVASDLSKTVIRAPFAGYVVERAAEVGEWVPVGGPVVEMIELSSVLVRVDLPESALPYMVIGGPVPVKVDALGGVGRAGPMLQGRIKHVMRKADPSARTFPVEIEIDNDDRLLAGGMFARVTVPAGPNHRVVAVPKDAIVERDGIPYVATVMPGENGGTVGVLYPVTVGADVFLASAAGGGDSSATNPPIVPPGRGDARGGGRYWVTIESGNIQPGTPVITRGNEHILPFPTPVETVDEKGRPVAGGE